MVFIIAHFSFNHIEKPGILWGKKILNRFVKQKARK